MRKDARAASERRTVLSSAAPSSVASTSARRVDHEIDRTRFQAVHAFYSAEIEKPQHDARRNPGKPLLKAWQKTSPA